MNRALPIVAAVSLAAFTGAHAQDTSAPHPVAPPTPVAASPALFHTLDDFRMVPVAAEPHVTDPVAIAYDEYGRAYVAEMNDYPYTDKANHKPSQENPTDRPIGKIRRLEDTDGDGVFDKSTVFAENLSWPTGVACWKGGVFVTAVPDFWYLKDTDGDGKADVQKKIASGFRKFNVQSSANTPVWGLDNRIYVAAGRNKGELQTGAGDARKVVAIPGGRDLRFDPRNPEPFEFVSGGIQFGNAFDDWGNRFLCSAGGSVHHAVMPAAAFDRNPWLPSRAAVRSCLDPDDPVQLFPITHIEGWRLQRYQDRAFVPRPGYTESRGVNPGDPSRPTSSCGPSVYRGDAYPEEYRGAFFVAESCYNLVYRLDAKRQGATFRLTKPARDRKADIVTSEDVWFRPIALVNAPDGCLHLLDFYRESIEHPWSLPDSFHARMDLLLGRDRGRIYRIEPAGFQYRPGIAPGGAASSELVALLQHRNAWHRETAQRLLFERQDKSVVTALEKMAGSCGEELGRLHALWTLHGLNALHPDVLTTAFGDKSPGIRANAARIAALMVSDHPVLLSSVTALAGDSDPSVRFQAALAIGAAPMSDADASAPSALVAIVRKDGTDSWARLAVLSSAVPHAASMLAQLLDDDTFLAAAHSGAFLGSLAHIVGARNQSAEVPALIVQLMARREKPDGVTLSIATGLAEGLHAARSSLGESASKAPGGTAFFAKLIDESHALASDPNAAISRRTAAIVLLQRATFEEVGEALKNLLRPGVPEAVQSSAATALGVVGATRAETGASLLEGWEGYSGAMRNQILQLLLAREERLGALLDAVESGKIQPYQLGPTRRDALVAHTNSAIAARAGKLFAGTRSREEVLAKYEVVLTLTGDPTVGETVYQSLCMACHKFREKGLIDLAPNLAVVSGWESERILTNIIDPNREVAPEYMEHIVETRSGDTVTGRISSESAGGITLKLTDNSVRDISRDDIATLKNSGRSLMPDGLEAVITPQQMADLIAYLKRS